MKRQIMKIHNMDGNDKPKYSNNQRMLPFRILSVTIIATTLLGVGIHSSPASAAKADEAILQHASGSTPPLISLHTLNNSQSVSEKSSEAARVPDSVMNFAEDTVNQLSVHAPFTTWDEAELAVTPLGPGTHGWLVTITENGLPQGYMIISASEDGGYVLSEYGIGPTLPFSQAPLNERLAAEGLLKGGTTLPAGSIVRKLYDVSPVWQVELPGKKPLYYSALNSELLPDQLPLTQTSATSVSLPSLAKGAVVSTVSGTWRSATPSTSSVGEQDPYDNLLWLTSAPLEAGNSTDLLHLLEERSTLIFRSAAHNAAFGSPFQLNGWQSWSSGNNEKPSAIYVSVPLRNSDTLRYLPASRLLEEGVFYASVDK
ncbi:hypothetical protein [Paenibacillus solani]|uniref:hypothetical protein n=1 Tax=Paenibacillus solani TaxID=1705565 RepID=UPI003D268DCC